MTNKEKALRLVWEHWKITGTKIDFKEFSFELLTSKYFARQSVEHAKLTASKISEYDPEEGNGILEELEKI